MANQRKSREFLEQQEHDASWARLRSEPWRPCGLHRASGSGVPRVQIVRFPTFSPCSFWEICELKSEWLLYSAKVVDRRCDALTVCGYELVKFNSDLLKQYLDRLTSVSMPVGPDLNHITSRDGIVTQLTLFGDLSSEVRYRWWSKHPPQWKPLIDITDEILTAFDGEAPRG